MNRNAFSALVTAANGAMVIVTASARSDADDPPGEGVAKRRWSGCLVGFHSQSSIEPIHYGVWISRSNHTYRIALESSHLAVHFLTVDDLGFAIRFGTLSGDEGDKFEGVGVTEGIGGVPQLVACSNRILLACETVVDTGGDHVLFTGPVVESRFGGADQPDLLRLDRVVHLSAGHDP